MRDKIFKINDFKEMCEFNINNIKYIEKYNFDELSLLLSRKVFVINLSNYIIAVISHISGNKVRLNEAHSRLLNEGYTGYYLRYKDFKSLLELRNLSSHSSEELLEFSSQKYNAHGIIELLEIMIKLCIKYKLTAIDLNPLTIDKTIAQIATNQFISYANPLRYPTNIELNKRLIKYIRGITSPDTWDLLNGETDRERIIDLMSREIPNNTDTNNMNLF